MGGFVAKAIGGLLGVKEPKVSSKPAEDVGEASRKVKKSRTALLETEGGIVGEELNPSDVSQRNTLLGN